MLHIYRNLFRRKLRTTLTIFGIIIGIFALTVMGSLSEFINRIVEAQIEEAKGTISVDSKFSMGAPGSTPLPKDTKKKIEAMKNVKRVVPFVVTSLGKEEASPMSGLMGVPPEDVKKRFLRAVELQSGEYLTKGDVKEVIIGSAIAKKYKLKVGDKATFRHYQFKVKGVLKPYNQLFYNDSVIAPLETVRKIGNFSPDSAMLIVFPQNPKKAETLAKKFEKEIKDIRVSSPREAEKQAKRSTAIFSAIVLSGALLALIIGGLSTMNTMVMAISERTREIGIKKALGATGFDIVKEYVTEAAIIGFIGGLIGLVLGFLATLGLNELTNQQFSLEIFEVTGRLVIFALIFATSLGAIAGIYPAVRAARLSPVKALGEE